ncbi:MAG: transporter substrate-binding domain-containing protein [Moraxella sp.]|nr:transporter substrate-binding domain-containing protein [Moraxella sp.]
MKQKMTAVAVMISVMALAGCGADTPKTADKVAQDTTKTVRIATESNFKPFSYMDASGNLLGFEIDLAHAMCEQMQAQCEIISQDWDGLIPGLNAHKFDAIMAGMSVTLDRQKVVDFSEPYFNNTLVLVAKKSDDVSIDDVNGKNVATQQATVSADYLKEHYPQAVVKVYDKQDNAYLDLTAGRADFMLSDIVPMSDWLKSEAGTSFEIKGEPIDIGDTIAVAVRKDDKLAEELNTALTALKANGEYDKIVAKYFDGLFDGVAVAATTSETATSGTAPNTATDTAPTETASTH